MQQLSNTQRNYLRKLAHELRPVVQIGKNGMTELVVEKVQQELTAHELIKVKFGDFQDQKHELSQELAAQTDSALIGVIGNTAILYRPPTEMAEQRIVLPEG